jgi:hypothetical protein
LTYVKADYIFCDKIMSIPVDANHTGLILNPER